MIAMVGRAMLIALLSAPVALAQAPKPSAEEIVAAKRLTLQGALDAIATAIAAARSKNAPGGAIAVVDAGGHLIALERLDNTFEAASAVATGKARTAALFDHPTSYFEDAIKNGRTALIAMPEFTPLQGGVPILAGTELIGAIGVSGTASAAQDEEVAIAGAAALR